MEYTRIIAVRHGETAWNKDGRIQGHLDIPLNATGLWQAQRLARALADEDISAVYSSDLSRAWQTAEAIAQAQQLAVKAEPRLRERCFGDFQGKSWTEMETDWPEAASAWRRREPAFTPPGGENLLQLQERVLDALVDVCQRHWGEQIVLVAHGGVMDMLYRTGMNLDLQATRTWTLGNATVNRLLWTPEGLHVVGWSDTSHLSDTSTLDESTT